MTDGFAVFFCVHLWLSRTGRSAAAALLQLSFRLQTLQFHLCVIDEGHRVRDGSVAGALGDEAVHLLADAAVGGMALRRGAQLDDVHRFAREAMHVIELRTAPQGHPAYRRVCQQMHRLIAERAGHRAVADAMTFVDHTEVELERLKAERELEKRRSR